MDSTPSRLVLHADDLGMNRAVTDGILRGFRQGLLTSTSLLANASDADRALQQWNVLADERAAGRLPSTATRKRLDEPDRPFDLGVHLNLTEGRPLSGSRYPAELLDPAGRFPGVLALFVRLRRYGAKFHAAIRTELDQQVQLACDHGLRPTHLNGHQYIEMMPAVAQLMPELLGWFGIGSVRVARERSLWQSTVLRGRFRQWPLAQVKRAFAERFRRRMDALGVAHPDVFFGTVSAGDIDLRLLRRFLNAASGKGVRPLLPERPEGCFAQKVPDTFSGLSVEIGLHPGEASEIQSPEERADGWHDPLIAHRPKELQMLCSAELPALLESAGWRLGRLST